MESHKIRKLILLFINLIQSEPITIWRTSWSNSLIKFVTLRKFNLNLQKSEGSLNNDWWCCEICIWDELRCVCCNETSYNLSGWWCINCKVKCSGFPQQLPPSNLQIAKICRFLLNCFWMAFNGWRQHLTEHRREEQQCSVDCWCVQPFIINYTLYRLLRKGLSLIFN